MVTKKIVFSSQELISELRITVKIHVPGEAKEIFLKQSQQFFVDVVKGYLLDFTNKGVDKLLGTRPHHLNRILVALDLTASEEQSIYDAIQFSPTLQTIQEQIKTVMSADNPDVWGVFLDHNGTRMWLENHGDYRILEWTRENMNSRGKYIGGS